MRHSMSTGETPERPSEPHSRRQATTIPAVEAGVDAAPRRCPARLPDLLMDGIVLGLYGNETAEIGDAMKGEFVVDMEAMARHLAGPNPCPITRSLALTAAMFWHELRLSQTDWSSRDEDAKRKIDRSLRRYLNTLRALATIRRLS